MLLRTRIFRQLVIFTLIPALIIAAVSYFLLIRAIDQTSRWLTGAAPERTINSLRITESRLQQDAEMILSLVKPDANDADEYGLDWLFMDDSLITEPLFEPEVYESLLLRIRKCAGGMGPLRSVVGNHLVIGYSTDAGNGCLAGGYIFDREYLDGYQSAIAGLSESRDFKNILPAYLMFIGFTGVSVLAIVVVAAYVLSRRLSASITTPLERLAISAGDIAPGKSPKKIALAGTDEVMGLTDALNRMIIDLEENRRRLMAAERVAAWQEFARRMAHELKNPLTPISISLYRIKKRLQEAGGYERHAESIEAIAAELKHLERMAADYSSLAGLPEPKYEKLDFTALARKVIELFTIQLENYSFKNRIEPFPIAIEGDPDRLREVMVNLVKNALQFSPEHGRIVISTGHSAERVYFSVMNENKDENTSDQNLRSAKMPYYTTRPKGTGLGLAIAEKIIIDHGGTLNLRLINGMIEARFEIPVGRPVKGIR